MSVNSKLSRNAAFTLIEMIVVIAIIALLLGLVLPGAAAMWKQRNEAGTINLMRGLLESARSQARRSGERGLLFYIDPIDNVQRVAFIEAEPPNVPDAVGNVQDREDCGSNPDCVTPPMTVNRFSVTTDKVYTVPPPYRVAPAVVMRWAECIDTGATATCKDDCGGAAPNAADLRARLGNDVFHELGSADPEELKAPRQRNHFSIVFDRNGTVQVGRYVLVHDRNSDKDTKPRGDKLRMVITPKVEAQEYYNACGQTAEIIPPGGGSEGLSDMVCYDDVRVANFPSVDGLVVYDNSVVEGLSSPEEAGDILVSELLANGRPLYVGRQTGDIIMGEKGR